MRKRGKLAIIFMFFMLLVADKAVGGDLVAHWTFEEASGNLVDQTEYGNDCTATGTPDYQQGGAPNRGNSINFDGVDERFDCGSDSSIGPTDYISISAWVKIDSTSNYDGIISRGSSADGTDGYGMSLSGAPDDKMTFWVENWTDNVASISIGSVVREWGHYVGTYDGSTVKIYLNGVLGTTDPATVTMSYPSGSLRIGQAFRGNAYCFDGRIDDVRIWNYALSAIQVQHLYQKGSYRAKLDKLTDYIRRLNEKAKFLIMPSMANIR